MRFVKRLRTPWGSVISQLPAGCDRGDVYLVAAILESVTKADWMKSTRPIPRHRLMVEKRHADSHRSHNGDWERDKRSVGECNIVFKILCRSHLEPLGLRHQLPTPTTTPQITTYESTTVASTRLAIAIDVLGRSRKWPDYQRDGRYSATWR